MRARTPELAFEGLPEAQVRGHHGGPEPVITSYRSSTTSGFVGYIENVFRTGQGVFDAGGQYRFPFAFRHEFAFTAGESVFFFIA